MSTHAPTRSATHAGSWYSGKSKVLEAQLRGWLDKAEKKVTGPARAIISPHAGYSYAGPTAAHAYKHVHPEKVRRVFLLGPSHHHYTRSCLLSKAQAYQTPLGSVSIDQTINKELLRGDAGLFGSMDIQVDEDEHSLEMCLPFIQCVMSGHDFTLVPILVGGVTRRTEQAVGHILAPYLDHQENLFVISSDFCHWGGRFDYTWYDRSCGEIWQSIVKLDRMGMDAIESQDPEKFAAYQKEYGNTICGRHPIGILLHAISQSKIRQNSRLTFVDYSQSGKCKSFQGSSVSYAAGVLTVQA